MTERVAGIPLPLDWTGAPRQKTAPASPSPVPDGANRPSLADPLSADRMLAARLSADRTLADPPPSAEVPPEPPEPEVVVRLSARRKKTAAAHWEDGRIVVVLPARMPKSMRQEMVNSLVQRVLSRRQHLHSSDEELADRARSLADRYVDQVCPTSVRWVTNQGKRWGSCTTSTGEIRLSHRLRGVPDWVVDAVLVHELAHLLHADHSAEFHAIAGRYPRQDEATTFLEGYSFGLAAGSEGC